MIYNRYLLVFRLKLLSSSCNIVHIVGPLVSLLDPRLCDVPFIFLLIDYEIHQAA